MSDKPSYQLAYEQRIRGIQDSIKTGHPGPVRPMQDLDTVVGKIPGTNKPTPGSIQLGEGSSR
jgi:hypothetical protein